MVLETFDKTRENAPGHYGLSQTALLLLDYKDLVISKIGPRADAAVVVAAELIKWAKAKGIITIHALVDFSGTAPFKTCKEFDRLSALVQSVQKEGGGGASTTLGDVDVEVHRRPGYISALQSHKIKDFLKKKGVKSLVVLGLSSGGCVLRTALDAAENEFVVTVIRDGCADAKDDVHEFLFSKVFGRGDFVATASEFSQGYDALYP